MNSNIIELKNIYKSYNTGPQRVEVLKGIDLTIAEGEVALIVGPSGVGKSTLLHVLGALDIPDSGEVVVDGKRLNTLNEEEQARFRNQSIGFVFQFHHLLPEFTALENVYLPSMMHEPFSAEKEDYARFLLNEVGLSHRLEHKPGELSGGEQQRVAVARALINKPRVLLADEPTGNLDSANSRLLFDLLLDLNQKFNQTLVVVTHAENMAHRAKRTIQMEDGRIAI
jgi:lipoprotein-releasing system ATP-binding protein